MMNALRWNPSGAFADTSNLYSANLTTKDSVRNGNHISVILELNVTSTASTLATFPLPYQDDHQAICSTVTLTSTAAENSGSISNYGPYAALSPIRPLCFTVQSNVGGIEYADMIIRTPLPANVTVSSSIILDADLEYPVGFKLVNFTATSSIAGQMHQALQFSISPSGKNIPITVQLPQLTYPPKSEIKKLTDISVLKFNEKTGSLSFFSAASFVIDSPSSPLLSITVTLPDEGFYVFGYMDIAQIDVLPISYNVWINYVTDYQRISFRPDGEI